MTTLVRKNNKPSYRDALELVRGLSLSEQRRLRAELDRLIGVELKHPESTPTSIQRGKRMARAVRAELSKKMKGTLEDIMRQTRGRSW